MYKLITQDYIKLKFRTKANSPWDCDKEYHFEIIDTVKQQRILNYTINGANQEECKKTGRPGQRKTDLKITYRL